MTYSESQFINEIADILNKKNCKVLKCFNLIKKYNSNDWKLHKNYFNNKNENKYYKKILFRNEYFELVLIKWNKGSTTSIHCHPSNGCLLKILEGSLEEKRYIENMLYQTNKLKVNEIGFMDDVLGGHKITALEESYSLHLYSPPNYYN